jgi:hypothetical protein
MTQALIKPARTATQNKTDYYTLQQDKNGYPTLAIKTMRILLHNYVFYDKPLV